eukprot:2680191-Lingulodinium_polyedra.AAC.1
MGQTVWRCQRHSGQCQCCLPRRVRVQRGPEGCGGIPLRYGMPMLPRRLRIPQSGSSRRV